MIDHCIVNNCLKQFADLTSQADWSVFLDVACVTILLAHLHIV